jgi:3-deoxy-7-phosphoheptulonate synthase
MGLMIESNINAGNQRLTKDLGQLAYGVSVTDPCIDWSTTASLLRELSVELKDVLKTRSRSFTNADAA